jgi:transcription elongation factor GreB
VRHLRKRLDGMVIVDRPPTDPARVFFGAWVTLEAESGETLRYRIVGPDEFDRAASFISMDSPLGRALIGKRLDDEVTVALEGGTRTYALVGVEYEREG